MIEYEIVLASGVIVIASATKNTDLWRALKGGGNNFGIVTRFTVRCFPTTDIWSGFLYFPSSQAHKCLAAFHLFVGRSDSKDPKTKYDPHAAGPMLAFSYVHAVGFKLISANLVYTKLPENTKEWPSCWKTSSFKSLWRLWSTCKIRSLSSATDEVTSLNPPGRRQVFGTTTISNDAATLAFAHDAYNQTTADLRGSSIKGLVFTLVLQPLLPIWACLGDPNPIGLNEKIERALVIVSFTVNWNEGQDDDFVKTITRKTIERIEAFAIKSGTNHPHRYINYCSEWQRPYESYGEENLRFLRDTAKKYDPDELFQKGCLGGFKLYSKAEASRDLDASMQSQHTRLIS